MSDTASGGGEPGTPVGKAALGLARALSARGRSLTAAESCTGGLVAAALTSIPGSSAFFWGGVVAYSLAAKRGLLGLPASTLDRHGPVSRETAAAMLAGILSRSEADLGLAVTGWAGPEAPAEEAGPGRVVLAWGERGGRGWTLERRYAGDREAVRRGAVLDALEGAERLARGEAPAPEALPIADFRAQARD